MTTRGSRGIVKANWVGARRLGFLLLVPLLMGAGFSTGSEDVLEAARKGEVEAVRLLLAGGADVNIASGDGMTPLHWAAERGESEIARLLLAAGADVTAGTRIGAYTPLHLAAKRGRTGVSRLLIEAGAAVTATTESGVTPLHLAAAADGGEDVVAGLIEAGADVNAVAGAAGQTPLMFAASSGRTESTQRLLDAGADPAVTTPIVDALAQLREDLAAAGVVRQALRDGSPPEVQAAVRVQREFLAQSESVNGSELEREFQLRRLGDWGGGRDGGLREFLVRRTGGMTALLHAVREGHVSTTLALLDGGADVNQVSPADATSPLLIAAQNGHFDLMLRLLERGADPTRATSTDGGTPLFAVLQTRWAPHSGYPTPLAHLQQNLEHLDVLEALLEAGADPNVRLKTHLWYWEADRQAIGVDITGATPFWRAAAAQDIDAMRLLVAHGADPEIPSIVPREALQFSRTRDGRQWDDSGLPPVPVGEPDEFPIHVAVGLGAIGRGHRQMKGVPNGYLTAVKYLVEENGADVNAVDAWGYTPLHYAAVRGDEELIRYLVSKGADVTALSRLGQSPVDLTRGGHAGYFVRPAQPAARALLEGLGSPFVCEHVHYPKGTGDQCPQAGNTPFEDRFGFPRKPWGERRSDELHLRTVWERP